MTVRSFVCLLVFLSLGLASASALAQLGSIALDGSRGDVIVRINGQSSVGTALAAIGDINNDGFDDFAMGTGVAGDPGNFWIVFGRANFFATPETALTLTNLGSNGFAATPISGGRSGSSLDGAADFNGDGIDDLLVGSRDVNGNQGQAHIVFGANGLAAINLNSLGSGGVALNADSSMGFLGTAVGHADLNDDGFDDAIIGAPSPVSNLSSAFVVYGRASWPSALSLAAMTATDGFRITNAGAIDNFGAVISPIGDFDRDGVEDVMIATPNDFTATLGAQAGNAYVLFGSDDADSAGSLYDIAALNHASTPRALRVGGPVANQRFGAGGAVAADFNGDNLPDLAIGGGGANTGTGTVAVIYGQLAAWPASFGTQTLNGSNGVLLHGASNFRSGAVAAGDFNLDLLPDLIVGSPGSAPGRIDVLPGRGSSAPSWPALLNLPTLGTLSTPAYGEASADQFGALIRTADLDGDGQIELIVTAPTLNNGANRSYVIKGRAGVMWCDGLESEGGCR